MADQRDRPAGRDVELDVVEDRPAVEVLERDALEAHLAGSGRELDRVAGSFATSSGSSITWKIRSPEAVARCAWPIHMPSERSGRTSMPR